MEELPSLLDKYRRDRRKLLDFILSSDLITQIRSPAGAAAADINFDKLSVDYVLACVKSDGVLDMPEATKKHREECLYPIAIHSRLVNSYFLLSDPESSGSPPRRVPPSIEPNHINRNGPHTAAVPDFSTCRTTYASGDDFQSKDTHAVPSSSKSAKSVDISLLGLPTLKTGLSDDDLRESAYEILLACIASSGTAIHSLEDQKRDKGSKFLSGLKIRKDRKSLQRHCGENRLEHAETIRVQMQISEAMDECIRQRLMQFSSRKAWGQVDVPQISLELLNVVLKSDFQNERSYTQWRRRQVNVIEELLSSVKHLSPEIQDVGFLLERIKHSEEWDIIMSPAERTEVVLALRQVASLLSSLGGYFHIPGETCYWTAGYHFNIRLYEKLLFGIFDILDEGQLMEEYDEFLKLIKLTWSTLGITQIMHDALYIWVLFQRFVESQELMLLDRAILELQKVLPALDKNGKEEEYVNALTCTIACDGVEMRLCLVQAIFWSMNRWCDSRLKDYHLHFIQKPSLFKRVATMGLAVGAYTSSTGDKNKLMNFDAVDKNATMEVRIYVERSVEAAYRRVAGTIDMVSKLERKHPLALLASELKLIAEKELTVFSPILSYWYPYAGRVAAVLLHKLYGETLKPFLDEVSDLSENVRSVLSAAHILEHELTRVYSSNYTENGFHSPPDQGIGNYKLQSICQPIILDWLISQHVRISEWTGRAFKLEVWEPLSYQQKQAASVVEVFRIIEDTVDQFFRLNLPMDISHLQALLSIIFHTLDGYLLKLVSQLVEKHHLYPPAPPLTRYKETVFPIVKKKVVESVLLEEEVDDKLNDLTVTKLCVRLNTLQYMQKQIGTLEDGIKESWGSLVQSEDNRCDEESVHELFVATFDSIRASAAGSTGKICELIGTRVIFWDLRGSFIFHLYRGTVEGARLENILPQFDAVLKRICGLVDGTLRDLVVTSICKAALEGYIWVLLDGGPLCAFSDSDITMMEDDLSLLKDLFVADGEGLPRSLVEAEAKLAHEILSLFSLQTESVIQMLMAASERLLPELNSSIHGQRHMEDADTLIRVLCHRKDKEASKFLKMQYHLPASSDYDDTPVKDSVSKPASGAEILRSASARWSEKGHSSFISLKKKFYEGSSFRWT